MCSAYASIGETEKAASFAKKMPDTTQRKLITETLKGTKKYNHMQMQIAHSVFYDVLNSIALLMNNSYVSFDEGREIYDSDECIVLYNKIIDIINILLENGDFGDFNLLLANTYHCLTFLYAKKNESAAAMDYFKLAAKHTVIYDSVNSMPPLSDEYTSLLFKGVKFPFNTAHFPFTMSKYLLDKSFELDSLLPVSELEEIRNELRKHTEIN